MAVISGWLEFEFESANSGLDDGGGGGDDSVLFKMPLNKLASLSHMHWVDRFDLLLLLLLLLFFNITSSMSYLIRNESIYLKFEFDEYHLPKLKSK